MTVSKRLRFEILNRDNFTCHYCRSTSNELHVDHVVPVALGGDDRPTNLVAACKDCNLGKASTDPAAPPLPTPTAEEIAYEKARARVIEKSEARAKEERARMNTFIDCWATWDADHRYLTADWRTSVTMWLARGLSMARILEAMDIATGKEHLPPRSVYAYMAKICWNWVSDLEDAIKDELKSSENLPSTTPETFNSAQIIDLFVDKRLEKLPKSLLMLHEVA